MKKKARRKPPAKGKARILRERPKMPPISEEMKQWSAMLQTELSGWPSVATRPMFGMLGFYRGKKIFAALPVTRGLRTANSIIFRYHPMPLQLRERALKESRINMENRVPGPKWFAFEIASTADLRDALWWLNQAYELAVSGALRKSSGGGPSKTNSGSRRGA